MKNEVGAGLLYFVSSEMNTVINLIIHTYYTSHNGYIKTLLEEDTATTEESKCHR